MGWFFRRRQEVMVTGPQPGDIEAMADIHARSFARPWNAADIHRLLDGRGVAALVARPEGAGNGPPAGFVILREAADEGEIITIATEPASRRSGVGRALMHGAIRHLQGDRIARLFLEVSEDNAPALSLYRQLGFRRVGIRKGYYASERKDVAAPGTPKPAPSALVMELDLR
jgi:[ribosomal protein S18]-alanine N-acetyltransferase